VSILKGRQVAVKFLRSGEYDGRWTLYNCLISEQRVDGQLYVLIEGRCLAVSETLAEEVDAFAMALPSSQATLLSSNLGETEPAYNKRMASQGAGEPSYLRQSSCRTATTVRKSIRRRRLVAPSPHCMPRKG
jgi:uncharacterized protein (TIGR04141 family)